MPRTSGPFWAFFNALPVGAVLFDRDRGDFVEINDAACAQLGYDRDTLSRMTINELDAVRSPEMIRADRRGLSPDGPPRQVRTQLRRADGSLLHIDATLQGIVLNDRLLGYGVWTDVTEREMALAALRSRERDLARVQRIGRVGGYEIDLRSGFGNQRSPEYLRLHGLPADSADESHEAWVQRLHPDDRERVNAHFREFVAGDALLYEAEYRIVLPDGDVRWLSSVAEIERDSAGKARRMVGAHIDVTALRQAETAIASHAARLEEIDRRKNEFLAMLGHELRNPLAPILAVVERLRLADERAVDAAGRNAAYDVIQRQATHLRGLVDELLDIARITTGKIELTREDVDLRQVVEAAVEQVRNLIDDRRHQLQIGLPAHAVRVLGDAARLVQVVVNLLDNAAKYTDPGGRIRLQLDADPVQRLAVIEVVDSGRGIPADTLPVIFDLFVQGHQDRPSAEGGLGVGLTLVQQLIALHGGTIEVGAGPENVGSRFAVSLPALDADTLPRSTDAADDRDRSAAAMPESVRQAPPRVVLVDDNVDAAEAMAELLRLTGHEVTTRHDGDDLIDVVRAFRPHVVILDIGLPGRDGHALAAQLRATPDCGQPMLIALTGYGLDDDRQRSRAAGFSHHFVKPVDFQALRETIAAAAPVA